MILEELSIIVDIALTIVTGFMAVVTYNMAKSTKESVVEMKLTREETNSAEVVTYFEVDGSRMYLIIENVGKTVAENVEIKFEPELKNSRDFTYPSLKQISYLPPNYKIKTFFDMTHSYYTKNKEYPHITFFISYRNIYGEVINRTYESNLNYLQDIHFLNSESETLEMSLSKIKKEFEKTNNTLTKINKEFKNANSKVNGMIKNAE